MDATNHLAHLPKLVDKRDTSPEPAPAHVVAKRKQRIFLEKLAETGKAKHSAFCAGSSLQALLYQKKHDPDFAHRWSLALEAFALSVKDEVIHRAMEGEIKAVYHQGQVVGFERNKSDGLLQTLAKAALPDEFGDKKQVDITHHKQGVIIIAGASGKSTDEWEMDSVRVHNDQKKLVHAQQEKLENVIDVESTPVEQEVSFEDLL
jgi:hypothetical protein